MVGNNSNLEIFNRIKETNANFADEYSNSKTYIKDEYCIYNNTLYKANQAIDTAEEFTESHWTETTVGTELKSQADSISALNSSLFTPGAGTYIGRFHYAGYTSGAFVSFPQYILNNYEISANTFNIPGYEEGLSVDEVFVYANGVMFSHTFESYEIEYSGRSCTIDSVTFTPKS